MKSIGKYTIYQMKLMKDKNTTLHRTCGTTIPDQRWSFRYATNENLENPVFTINCA